MSTAAPSHTHAHSIAANEQTRGDPTRTKTLRRTYSQKLRGHLGRLSAAIRQGVVKRDAFGLRAARNADPEPLPSFTATPSGQRQDAFMRWLRRQEERGILEEVSRNGNTYVRQAYSRGVDHADAHLNKAGVEVPESALEETFNRPVHQQSLQRLFSAQYSELEGVTEAMNQEIGRELADGFSRGQNPTTIARRITDRVSTIGKTRAETTARTGVIKAHSEATLNRYEEAGVRGVTVRAEWSTAGDSRVCPVCATLEGQTWTIEKARTETFRYEASDAEPSSLTGEYPVKPPSHPRCRCSLLPAIIN